ncbi:uncharacterized protein PAC_18959 [Phialocephala subalpina]|uniref:Heterokaryon incompatibility domain-containing protein n=1 Tax=Phialocephala subalpina TaxID=576137 RepID=A0A1L7XVM1_9HELO|nr:uncharacterized protein PAC_18959 [Phialocephala subalpina]
MSLARYSDKENIFPNRPHWDEQGIWAQARNRPAICWCPKNAPPTTNLCETCQKIRIRHLILCEAEGRMVDLGKLNDIVNRPECDLCSLVTLAARQTWRGLWDEESRSSVTCYFNALDPGRQQVKGYALQVTETGSNWQWLDFDLVFKGHDSDSMPVGKVFEISPKVDIEFLKASIRACEDMHERCMLDTKLATPDRMSIIDLHTMSIRRAPEACRYLALSYVWGKITEQWLTLKRETVKLLSHKNALVQACLPQTVRDAMQLCLDLGERYLWVDSLCITQDDPITQKQQIDIMDSIYASATLTIVAAAGDHADSGLPGISKWSREIKRQTITIQDIEISNTMPRLGDTAERSVWNTRGWTYQERMFSRRCIFLTEAQAFFACSQGVSYERKRLIETGYGVEQLNPLIRSQTLQQFYFKAVQEYTVRNLTSHADILRAFQGIMNEMSRKYNQEFFFGLPNKNFEDALLWQHAGQAEKRTTSRNFPSWSWTSVNGAIKYSFMEKRIIDGSPIPAAWQDGEEPEQFHIDWLLNAGESKLLRINETPPISIRPLPPPEEVPADLVKVALQKPGRLLFRTKHAFLSIANSVPIRTADSWWADYTQNINFSVISMASILRDGSGEDPIGFIELDKIWAQQNVPQDAGKRRWEFLAISLAATNPNDYMNLHFTMRRNIDYPMIYSRNVRQLIVNVMLVEREGEVARRLGVGKIYLDCWELIGPQNTWVVVD